MTIETPWTVTPGLEPGPAPQDIVVVGSDGMERPEDTNDPVCAFTRDLTLRCD